MKGIKPDQVAKKPSTNALFTGPVTVQPLLTEKDSKQFNMSVVNFAKGVRNKFHTHTSDQVLIVSAGKGIVATEKEEVVVKVGDIIQIPAGEVHWHGATKDSEFSHIYFFSSDSKTKQIEN